MSKRVGALAAIAGVVIALATLATPLAAQGKSKRYEVTHDRAVIVTRQALGRQGYDIVRVETRGDTRVIYYRLGNRGKGKGKGKLEKVVVRREAKRVYFEGAPPAVLIDIDVHLRP